MLEYMSTWRSSWTSAAAFLKRWKRIASTFDIFALKRFLISVEFLWFVFGSYILETHSDRHGESAFKLFSALVLCRQTGILRYHWRLPVRHSNICEVHRRLQPGVNPTAKDTKDEDHVCTLLGTLVTSAFFSTDYGFKFVNCHLSRMGWGPEQLSSLYKSWHLHVWALVQR